MDIGGEKAMSEKRDKMTIEVEFTCGECSGYGDAVYEHPGTGKTTQGRCPVCCGRPKWKKRITLAELKELLLGEGHEAEDADNAAIDRIYQGANLQNIPEGS